MKTISADVSKREKLKPVRHSDKIRMIAKKFSGSSQKFLAKKNKMIEANFWQMSMGVPISPSHFCACFLAKAEVNKLTERGEQYDRPPVG